MKTRRILAASTAALLSFASVAVVASAAGANANNVLTVTVSQEAEAEKDIEVVVKDGGITLFKGTHYTVNTVEVQGSDGKVTGWTVTVAATVGGDYDGSTDPGLTTYNVTKVEPPAAVEAKVTVPTKVKDETTLKAAIKVEAGGKTLTENVDYTVTVTETKDKDGNVTGWNVKLAAVDAKKYKLDKTTATVTKEAENNTESKPPVTTSAVDIADIDEDGVVIGAGVKAIIDEKTAEKFGEDFNITASPVAVKAGEKDKDGNILVSTDSNVVKGLSKALKKEIAKVKTSDFKIINIDLADGGYVEGTAPAAIKFTVNVPFDAKVYHVNGDSVEKLKSTSKKRTDGTYDVSFSTKTFSPFIFTTADLKNAKATNASNDPVDSGASNADGTNPSTGIALAIAPVVLAAGAVAVVALKKKH